MKPRITVITLGVDDLERGLKFYRDGLGLPTQGIVGTEFEHGAVAFFDLQHGLKLAIWPRKYIAHEAKVMLGPRSATEFTLGHNVASKAEVDAVMAQVQKAGATITDRPRRILGWLHRLVPGPRWASVGSGVESGVGTRRLETGSSAASGYLWGGVLRDLLLTPI